ncbi:MAG: hypothetical protein CMB80_27570 [Flammeovirgaceae bacterium]|nr:hypothetical protein [Flammeovirgaceae bacterium]MBR11372.1 hypothetical protein [Rickettsiales bacterium]HCX20384.1 hypothetical protein [Cytophagales bacterium]|tara:strand:+ start:2021 stop:2470 length:450 start_codon:yes stop_codon:yes gene_type:complete
MKFQKPTSKTLLVCLIGLIVSLLSGVYSSPSFAAMSSQKNPENEEVLKMYLDGHLLQKEESIQQLKSVLADGKFSYSIADENNKAKASVSLIVVRKGLGIKSLDKKYVAPEDTIMAGEIFNYLRSGDHLVVSVDWGNNKPIIETIKIKD